MNLSFDVIVLGAGAAGLMCAIEAGKRGCRVAVLERADRIGKKILISGGGRCNFTNLHCRPEDFLSANPHFAKSALARFTPADFIALVEKHGIRYHEKTLGQLFCDRSASEITGMLERECAAGGVQILVNTAVRADHERPLGEDDPGWPGADGFDDQGLQQWFDGGFGLRGGYAVWTLRVFSDGEGDGGVSLIHLEERHFGRRTFTTGSGGR
jgi:hypothetical protein